MKYSSFIFMALLCWAAVSIAEDDKWTYYHPKASQVNALVEQEDVVWAATRFGLVRINKETSTAQYWNKTNSGLPHNPVSALAVDEAGSMWIAVEGYGLVHFDGSTFTSHASNSMELSETHVKAMAVDADGGVWIATENGLFHYDDSELVLYDQSNSNLPQNSLTDIVVTGDGTKWVGTEQGGIASSQGRGWSVFSPDNSDLPSERVRALAADDSGAVWVATWKGLVHFSNSNMTVYNESNTGMPVNRVLSLHIQSDGTLLVGTDRDGLVMFDGTSWNRVDGPDAELMNRGISSLVADIDGTIWAGTSTSGGDIYQMDDTHLTHYSTANSPVPGGEHVSIYGSEKWIGAHGRLLRLTESDTTLYTTQNSDLPGGRIWQVKKGKNGEYWIGTQGSGVARFENDDFTIYNAGNNNAIANNQLWPSAVDDSGTVWIGSFEGLISYDGSDWQVYNISNSGLPHNSVFWVAVDQNNVKWIATAGGGLAAFDDENWTVYNRGNSGLPSDGLWHLAIDKNGNKWIASIVAGVFMFDGSDWTVYNRSNSPLITNEMRNILVDEENQVWATGNNGGLAMFDGETWTVWHRENSGIDQNNVRQMAVDENGDLWITTVDGILVYDANIGSDTSVKSKTAPVAFELQQNYPNPFNPTTTIEFGLPTSAPVKLAVFDLLGREVALLMDERLNAGQHRVTFDASHLTSGVYVYRLQAGAEVYARKLMLVR